MPDMLHIQFREDVHYEVEVPAAEVLAAIAPGFEPGGFWGDEEAPTAATIGAWLTGHGVYGPLDEWLGQYADDAHVEASYEREITAVDVVEVK